MATQTEEIDQKVIVPTEAIIESETTTHQEVKRIRPTASERFREIGAARAFGDHSELGR